ncbi:MAG: M28 family metallopeptidase, partial [Bradymonadaceae bacterium]
PADHGHRADQRTDELPILRPAPALEGIAVAHLTARAGQALLEAADFDLGAVQRQINETTQPSSQLLSLSFNGHLPMNRTQSTLYNCIGRLSSAGTQTESPPIILGAHYDGLGLGAFGSFHTEGPAFHPGADDNASGIAALLEVARQMNGTEKTRRRDVYFVALAGEEIGLRGSRRMAHLWVEKGIEKPGVYINMDMIGRLRSGRIHVAAPDEELAMREAMTRAARKARLAVDFEPLYSRHSDHLPFAEAGFSALSITTGRHGDYHMPSDTIDRIEWSGITRLTGLVTTLLEDLADQ